jgi:hypothetical protein
MGILGGKHDETAILPWELPWLVALGIAFGI